MKKFRSLIAVACLACSGLGSAGSAVDDFVQTMVKEHGFKEAEVRAILDRAQKKDDILEKISKPAERTLNWSQYKNIFISDERIDNGVEFWKRNQAALERAEKTYGVPPQIVVAIIGVETSYGRITGRNSVLDALYTLAFYYPKRSEFFTKELVEYLLLTREEGLDPAEPEGSYAGAMGLGQFMPSSYRAYAVDFDDDGKRDIWENETDAIGSVANYFARHQWQAGEQVARPLQEVANKAKDYAKAGSKPSVKADDLRQAGVKMPKDLPGDALVSLIELETFAGQEYWLGQQNFYVITRYNTSTLYAMAVFQLSKWIQSRMLEEQQQQAEPADKPKDG